MKEAELVDKAQIILSRMGFISVCEIPNMGQSVDIAAVKNNEIILFEAKVNNWRKAIAQASYHGYVADFVFIILPQKKYCSQMYDLADSFGIGVIEMDMGRGRLRMTVKPKRSEKIWTPQRNQFMRHLEEILHEN